MQQAEDDPLDEDKKSTRGPQQSGIQTFARLQQQGVARPGPMVGMNPLGQPQMGQVTGAPQPPQGGGTLGQMQQPRAGGIGQQVQAAHPPQPGAPPPAAAPPPAQSPIAQGLLQHLTGGGYQNPLQGQMQQGVSALMANPSAYGSDVVQGTFDRLKGQLDQTFQHDARSLDEMMAKRGLYDSTMAGQKYSDLATEKNRTLADMIQQLTAGQAQQYGADRASALNAGMQFGQQGLNQFQANTGAQQGWMGQAMNYDQNQFGNSLATAQQNNQQQQQMMQLWMQLMGLS